MPALRLRRRLAARLALAAAVALAVLPTLSRALQRAPLAPPGAEVCRSDTASHPHAVLDACAHCVLAATAVLPAGGAVAVAAMAAEPPPCRNAASGRATGPIREAAPARAPPRSV